MQAYPAEVAVRPTAPLDTTLKVPGSKSLTNRALLIAALAAGKTVLRDCLLAEDSEVMVRALNALGLKAEVSGTTMTVHGQGGKVPAAAAQLDLRLSGTSIRFLTALCTLGHGNYVLDGNARMRERPIEDLLVSLRALGAEVSTPLGSGCPPVEVAGRGLKGGVAEISGSSSSQYLSALLMSAPYAAAPVALNVTGDLQSKPFIDMTLSLMADFGVAVQREGYTRFAVANAVYQPQDYAIEGDAMAAGYFWAAAAIAGGRVRVDNVGSASVQGDKRLADVLGEMGCTVTWTADSCEVTAPLSGLRGGTFDLNDMSDQAQTLAVVALFADSPTRIENVWNMRIKETDRLQAVATELRKLGAEVEEGRDYLVIHPLAAEAARPAQIATYGDHRMAMAFALAGLRLPGVVIQDPGCVAKTFPQFFDVLEGL